MKVWSWGRASRSVGNKPVDFVLLDSFFKKNPKAILVFCIVIAGLCFNISEKTMLENSFEPCLIGILLATSKSHPKIAVR